MKKYIPILSGSRLFAGVAEEEIFSMLACLNARVQSYPRGELVLRQGDTLDDITLLLEGRLHIQKDDYWGNRSILGQIEPGDMFGEAYAAAGSGPLLNDVAAVEDSTVIFFDVKRILTTCSSACRFHTAVVQNLFTAISEKNRQLVQKLGHISCRSTREKLISYLSEQAKKQQSSSFTIPFDRQQLADFLSVDRSAMSRELCRLREEGLLTFHKNTFRLL